MLTGNYWYKEYGLVQYSGNTVSVKVMGLLREKALLLLERLNQLLEEKQQTGFLLNSCNQKVSGMVHQQFQLFVKRYVLFE